MGRLRLAKQSGLIMMSFNNIVFGSNLKNLLKLNALRVLIRPICQMFRKKLAATIGACPLLYRLLSATEIDYFKLLLEMQDIAVWLKNFLRNFS